MLTAKRVMIVDDFAVIRGMVRSLFEAHGFEVEEAENGAEAVKQALGFDPDLIVLDLAMPVMNGLEAAKKLTVLMPDVPLLMLTSHSGRVIEQEARACGFSAIVSKNNSAERLVTIANALLEKRRCA